MNLIYKARLLTAILGLTSTGYLPVVHADVSFLGQLAPLSSITISDSSLPTGNSFTDTFNFSVQQNVRLFDSEFSSIVDTNYAGVPMTFESGTRLFSVALYRADALGNTVGSALARNPPTLTSNTVTNTYNNITLGSVTTTNFQGNIQNQSLSQGSYDLVIKGEGAALNPGNGYSGSLNLSIAPAVPEPEEWAMLLLGLPLIVGVARQKPAIMLSPIAQKKDRNFMKTFAIGNWRKRWSQITNKISLIETAYDREFALNSLMSLQTCQTLGFVNAHAMNLAALSEDFAENLASTDILFRDGSGMELLDNIIGVKPGLNMNGTDLIPCIIKRFDGKSIALFGTIQPYLQNAKLKILDSVAPHSTINLLDGFQSVDDYVQAAKEICPDLIILGMGMPKQELVAEKLRSALTKPCLIVCGGAIIDFLGNRVKRSPVIMQKLRIEWLFRLCQEPVRLFNRYVIGIPLFIIRAFKFSHYRTKTQHIRLPS